MTTRVTNEPTPFPEVPIGAPLSAQEQATNRAAQQVFSAEQRPSAGAASSRTQVVTIGPSTPSEGLKELEERHSKERWAALIEKTRALPRFNYLTEGDAYHRFSNVPCPENTAVRAYGSKGHQYLHANVVGEGISDRRFIASQAPNGSESFWGVVAEHDAGIIDLTTKKDAETVFPYYPINEGETEECDDINVKALNGRDDSTVSKMFEYEVVNSQTGKTTLVKRYHCTEWLDFSAGSLEMIDKLVSLLKTEPFQGPNTVIHCRAGIGRTGTLITSAILEEKISKGEVTEANLENTVLDIVVALRSQRGSGCVQTQEQLDCIIAYGKMKLAEKQPTQ